MFNQLIQKLFFSKSVPAKPSGAYSFRQSTIQKGDSQTTFSETGNKPSQTLNIDEQFQQEFYQFLFGHSQSMIITDELSEYIGQQIQQLLASPDAILDSLPLLPASLTELLRQINHKDFDTPKVVDLLHSEPAIAAKVLQLANSPFYNRSGKEIVDLKSAFMQLGVDGLSEGVINGFISRLIPQSDSYFRLYGQKLWQHSLYTGDIARQLELVADKKLAPLAYIAGLLSNLGDIVIYQLMTEAFSMVHPDAKPGSKAFIQLLQLHARRLTYFIAKHWKLPQPIQEVLSIQARLHSSSLLPKCQQKNPVACYVYEARLISELKLRHEYKALDEETIFTVMTSLLYTQEAKDYLSYLSAYQWKKQA